MSTITVFESITLDGVMQGLGRSDEDPRGGFAHGGGGDGHQDDVLMKYASENYASDSKPPCRRFMPRGYTGGRSIGKRSRFWHAPS